MCVILGIREHLHTRRIFGSVFVLSRMLLWLEVVVVVAVVISRT